MNNKFIIDDEFQKLLCIQRHSCRSNRQKVSKFDGEDLYKDLSIVYDIFEEHLPKPVTNVLDVGCGLGYIDVVIHDRYTLRQPLNFYMFDALDTLVSGQVKNFYSNLNLTKKFMLAHGANENNIFLVDALKTGSERSINEDPECFSGLPKMDLVVSMYSWGWHFSIEKYIKEVSNIMNTGGLLVLEMKDHTHSRANRHPAYGLDWNGREALINNNGFNLVDIVKRENAQAGEGSKRHLFIARKL